MRLNSHAGNRLRERLRTNAGKPLIGMAIYTYNPTFVEMLIAGGVDILWIEMEHATLTFEQASVLCQIASGSALLTMIRIPDSRRENVLKAAECGPDIIDLPMANRVATAKRFVQRARFFPEGRRGFFGVSRAVHYGLSPISHEQQRVNSELTLMIQIETKEAVSQAGELCAVPGIDAVLLGLGDLSASLGVPGQVDHQEVRKLALGALESARLHDKIVAVAGMGQDPSLWSIAGADILFCGSDVSSMKIGLQRTLDTVHSAVNKGLSAAQGGS